MVEKVGDDCRHYMRLQYSPTEPLTNTLGNAFTLTVIRGMIRCATLPAESWYISCGILNDVDDHMYICIVQAYW